MCMMAVTNNTLSVGTTLCGGRYRIDDLLASGGFGITYRVFDTKFDTTVVVKEFFMKGVNQRDDTKSVSVSNADNISVFDKQRLKFIEEAKKMYKLHHAHIVRVTDCFDENGTSYYVMDFVEGESLSAKMKRTGSPMTERQMKTWLPQLLDALEYVHAQHIQHLDLKPANIMVDGKGDVFLIDFGTSKQIDPDMAGATTSTGVAYTPGYAPAEQVNYKREKLGPWTDIYALGATFYNLLTNQPPPSNDDIQDDGEEAFRFPSGVSATFRQTIVRMMRLPIKQRPQSVEEVRGMLQASATPATPIAPSQALTDDSDVTVLGGAETIYSVGPVLKATGDPILDRLVANMVYVAGGTFMMGANPGDSEAYDWEKPRHQVTLSGFSIGRYEVTQEEWEAVMGSNPSKFNGKKRPVEQVSWDDCQEFIRKLNEKTGKRFRLPTEAEWEFAARGGNKSQGYLYSGSNSLDAVAWNTSNSGSTTHDVGQKSPNELGLYDMTGNVYEWCSDWYGNYSSSSQTNPAGPASGSDRVFRGGSWYSIARNCRVSFRNYSAPGYRSTDLGLRLAL